MSEMVGPGSKYSDEDRRRAAVEFLVTGNMTLVAKNIGIPRQTLVDWKHSEWWEEVISEVRHEKGEEIDAYLTKLIDSAFEQAQDRVENGDYRVTKDGELIRVPMGGRDLVIAGATVYDKQRLHRNEPTSIRCEFKSIEELAVQFRQLSSNHKIKRVNSIDGECEEIA